jgi:hypothetical protein
MHMGRQFSIECRFGEKRILSNQSFIIFSHCPLRGFVHTPPVLAYHSPVLLAGTPIMTVIAWGRIGASGGG